MQALTATVKPGSHSGDLRCAGSISRRVMIWFILTDHSYYQFKNNKVKSKKITWCLIAIIQAGNHK